jgi:hypothetical protein
MSFAVVVGNGISRRGIDPDHYLGKETWACNLAYRNLKTKNLVCCDKLIAIEALACNVSKQSTVWTRKRWFSVIDLEGAEALPDLPFPKDTNYDREMDWGSGTYAAFLACRSKHDIIAFVGFDLWDNNGKVNNVFAGEKGYGPADAVPVSPDAWIHQISVLMKHFPDKQFVFLNRPDWRAPEQWQAFDNFYTDDISQLVNL